MDLDARGSIDTYDLRKALRDYRGLDISTVTDEEVDLIIARYDKDGDRRIRFSEFVSVVSPVDLIEGDRLQQRKGTGSGFDDKTFLMYRGLWLTIIKIE